MNQTLNTAEVEVGIVGLGLMGSSIVASMLASGHKVIALAPVENELKEGLYRIRQQLLHCQKFRLLSKPVEKYIEELIITEDYGELAACQLVVECIVEDISIKNKVFNKIAARVGANTILASNTSAIPISILQQNIPNPERFVGIHWAEPAYGTRFLEIVCGEKTSAATADKVLLLAENWGKEPTVLRKDIRGFITNRLMYAVYREALSLAEQKHASFEDIDKSFRYDAGSWMTLMGIFRRMDFMGLEDIPAIYEKIYPTLNNSESIPPLMQKLVDAKARGVKNGKGFYRYTEEEAERWESTFASFNEEIYQLAARFPSAPEKE